MSKVSQKDCVFVCVSKVIKVKSDVKTELTSDMRASVRQSVYDMFKADKVDLKTVYTDEDLWKYVPGLISNHVRKDSRLNGGGTYVPKNPGKFTGSRDPEIKNLRNLLKRVAGTENEVAVKALLDQKVEEYRAKNVKVDEIDLSALSPEMVKIAEQYAKKADEEAVKRDEEIKRVTG